MLEVDTTEKNDEFFERIHASRPAPMESNCIDARNSSPPTGSLHIVHGNGMCESMPVEDLAKAWRNPLDW
jgi:hypothetical protein